MVFDFRNEYGTNELVAGLVNGSLDSLINQEVL